MLRNASLPKQTTLKIDKDMHPSPALEMEYVHEAVALLEKRGLRVEQIQATTTFHGVHYYITISPPIDASTANRLQYLLGDDSKRVDYNQARIDSGLREWNKLFEALGRKLRTIYSRGATH